MKLLAICAFALCTHVALAGEPSSVSTELVVAGEVRQELRLAPDDVRQIAKRRGVAEQGGYRGARLVDVLAEAQIADDAPLALRRTYIVAIATDG